MVTTKSLDYRAPVGGVNQNEYKKLNRAELQQSHFKLGLLNNDHKSMNQVSYPAVTADNAHLKDERDKLVSDLKNHHYSLGGQEPNYDSQAKVTFRPHPAMDTPVNFKKMDTLEIAKKDASLLKASNYQRDMVRFDENSYKEKPAMNRDQNSDRRSNWVYGLDGGDWKTETNKKFNNPEYDFRSSQEENALLRERMTKTNLEDHGDHALEELRYCTENQAKFNKKDPTGARGVMDPLLKQELTASHYEIGENDRVEKFSEYGGKFAKDPHGRCEKLSGVTHNPAFRLGHKSGDYRTMYRANYNVRKTEE